MIAKYKLGWASRIEHPLRRTYINVYRVIALIDIPVHGVKAGDIGGYVDHKKVLSQKGDCWIGGDALVLDKSRVADDAIIKDKAVVSNTLVDGNAAIYDRAIVSEMPGWQNSRISHSAKIYGDAQVISSHISDYSKVYEAAVVNRADVMGYSTVFGYAKILGPGVFIEDSKIFGYAEIHHSADITNSSIHCQVVVHSAGQVEDSILAWDEIVKEDIVVHNKKMVIHPNHKNSDEVTLECVIDGQEIPTCRNLYQEKPSLPESSLVSLIPLPPRLDTIESSERKRLDSIEQKYTEYEKDIVKNIKYPVVPLIPLPSRLDTVELRERKRLDEIEQKYAEYEQDIVKIIKYPIMTDLTNSFTAAFNSALRKTRRLYEEGDITAYKDSLDTLEDAFHIAESNARKISLSQLLPNERNKVSDARQMLALAMNDVSSDTEKKNAFKGAIRNLEGIVSIPDAAMTSLRQQIGLLEIEA